MHVQVVLSYVLGAIHRRRWHRVLFCGALVDGVFFFSFVRIWRTLNYYGHLSVILNYQIIIASHQMISSFVDINRSGACESIFSIDIPRLCKSWLWNLKIPGEGSCCIWAVPSFSSMNKVCLNLPRIWVDLPKISHWSWSHWWPSG